MDLIDGEKVNYGTVAKVGEGKQCSTGEYVIPQVYTYMYIYIYQL
jgi:hypothetical protein